LAVGQVISADDRQNLSDKNVNDTVIERLFVRAAERAAELCQMIFEIAGDAAELKSSAGAHSRNVWPDRSQHTFAALRD
jgi:hypothetical protein